MSYHTWPGSIPIRAPIFGRVRIAQFGSEVDHASTSARPHGSRERPRAANFLSGLPRLRVTVAERRRKPNTEVFRRKLLRIVPIFSVRFMGGAHGGLRFCRKWTLKAQFVPKWGLLTKIWAKTGPTGIMRRDEAQLAISRRGTPGPVSLSTSAVGHNFLCFRPEPGRF